MLEYLIDEKSVRYVIIIIDIILILILVGARVDRLVHVQLAGSAELVTIPSYNLQLNALAV